MLANFAPDVVIDMSRRLQPGRLRGPHRPLRLGEDVLKVWSEFHIEPERVIDAGDRGGRRSQIAGPGRSKRRRGKAALGASSGCCATAVLCVPIPTSHLKKPLKPWGWRSRPMSQENVEIVQGDNEEFNLGGGALWSGPTQTSSSASLRNSRRSAFIGLDGCAEGGSAPGTRTGSSSTPMPSRSWTWATTSAPSERHARPGQLEGSRSRTWPRTS